MPATSTQNKDGTVVVRNVGANEIFVVVSNVASNSTVNTFVTVSDAAGNIYCNACHFRKVLWSTDGVISVGRVTNSTVNVIVLKLTNSGVMDFDALGISTNNALDYTSSNLYINCSSSNSTLVLKLKKQTTPAGEWNNDQVSGLH